MHYVVLMIAVLAIVFIAFSPADAGQFNDNNTADVRGEPLHKAVNTEEVCNEKESLLFMYCPAEHRDIVGGNGDGSSGGAGGSDGGDPGDSGGDDGGDDNGGGSSGGNRSGGGDGTNPGGHGNSNGTNNPGQGHGAGGSGGGGGGGAR